MWITLIAGVLLLSLTHAVTGERHKGCFPEEELMNQAKKLLRRTNRHHERRPARAHSAASCSDFTPWVFSSDLKNRSLSPWRSRVEHDPHLIPSVYEEAECLCSGCIINGSEDTDYNSVPVKQNVMFLKKVACLVDPQKYSLEVLYKPLAVACTCAVPRQ